MMKVILTEEIRRLGDRGDIVTVKDGYARNYLLPKNLAKKATPGNLKLVEQQKRKWAMLEQQEKSAAEIVASGVDGVKLEIHKKVGAGGTLYGSVTSHEIADGLTAKGIEIDKRKIELDHPIKSLGVHDIEIRLHREVIAKIQVEVLPDSESEE